MTDLFSSPDQGDNNIDPTKDYFSELVGEGKKFKDQSSLARAKVEADSFIERLQRENAQMREEITRRASVEDFMTKLEASMKNTTTDNQSNHDGESGGNQSQGLSPEQLEALIEDRLSKRETARTQQQNLAFVQQQLKETLGPDYVNHLDAITSELGMTREQASAMAASQPKVFLRLVGGSGQTQAKPQTPDLFSAPRGQNTASFKPEVSERNNAFYENIRKTDPSAYWSPKIQNQMHQDAMRLGEAFFT